MDNAEYIEFFEPRRHMTLTDKWVVSNFIPGQREWHDHTYLHDNGETYNQVSLHPNLESTGLFNSKEEAQKALDAYRSKWNILTESHQTLPDNIVHKLLEPQIISDTFIYWEVISADNPNFALSDSNSIMHVAYRAKFYTFQSALFAKLRYERTHRDIMY